ncbi:hypothetical protein R1flu_023587 [Riccia fluitans]|uniref:Uncharacterized protein n=1 Tax=Riccia fluitans TaxID=41844 RepID=A0ABD1XSG2_9MARC
MAHDGTVELHVMASNGLLELAAFDPEWIADTFKDRLPWLKQFVGHIDSTVREAIVVYWASAQLLFLRTLQGALVATGYVLAQSMTGTPEVSRNLLESTVGDLPSSLPAAVAVGSDNAKVGESSTVTLKEQTTVVVQKAIIALGHLCFGDANPDLLSASLSALSLSSKSKAEDVLFSIGEALSFIWGGVPISADKILKTNFVSLSASTNFLNEGNPAKDDDVDMETGEDDDRWSSS